MTGYDPELCTEGCFAIPKCGVCHLTKPPRGRSVAPAMANGMCGWDCPGYNQEPKSGHLWPSERPSNNQETE